MIAAFPLEGVVSYEGPCSASVAALGDKIMRDIRPGAAFEPTYIYRLLTVIKSSLSEKVGARPDLPCGQVPSLVLSQCLPSALSAAVKWGCCGSRLALGTFSSE